MSSVTDRLSTEMKRWVALNALMGRNFNFDWEGRVRRNRNRGISPGIHIADATNSPVPFPGLSAQWVLDSIWIEPDHSTLNWRLFDVLRNVTFQASKGVRWRVLIFRDPHRVQFPLRFKTQEVINFAGETIDGGQVREEMRAVEVNLRHHLGLPWEGWR